MIKIGIFPNILDEDNKYETKFVYLKRYLDHLDAVPILLVIKDDLVIDEHLSMCDCFLIPGGDSISKACINLLKYAYECKKPVLGICLGMQALAVFSSIDDFSSLSLAEDFVVKKIGDDSHFKVKEKVLDISSS